MEEQVSLKEFLLERLENLAKVETERWKAHQLVHNMGQVALDASVKTLDTRLEGMNQFRAQVLEERAAFVTIQLYRAEYKALENKMNELNSFRSNLEGRIWMLGVVLGGMQIGLLALFHFWGNK